MKDGKPVSAASSHSCFRDGVEVQINIVGENTFGIAWYEDEIAFMPGSMDLSGDMCKKL